MKKSAFLILTIFFIGSLTAQNVGIGVPAPQEKLHVDGGNIKVGAAIWSSGNDRVIRFGDGDYVHIGEVGGDDQMEIKAAGITILANNLRVNVGTPAAANILTSDASGNASWQVFPAAASSFRAVKAASQLIGPGSTITVDFPTIDYDPGAHFAANGFIVPATGVYHFDVKLLWNLSSNAARYNALVILSASTGFFPYELSRSLDFIEPGASGIYSSQVSTDAMLTAGQTVYVGAFQNSAGPQSVIASSTSFSGHRIY